MQWMLLTITDSFMPALNGKWKTGAHHTGSGVTVGAIRTGEALKMIKKRHGWPQRGQLTNITVFSPG